MKRLSALIVGLLLASVAFTQTTVTTAPPSCTAVITCKPVQVTIPGSTGGGGSTTPPAATSWVYHNGQFLWPGDWSFSAEPNYKDTAGAAASGYDIALTLKGQWGGWLPYAPGQSFNLTPYTAITFALKPASAGAKAQIYFVKAGDDPVGNAVDPFSGQYGPTPTLGQWNTYRIPLSAFGVSGVTILKFSIQDQSGRASGTAFYLNDVGFL